MRPRLHSFQNSPRATLLCPAANRKPSTANPGACQSSVDSDQSAKVAKTKTFDWNAARRMTNDPVTCFCDEPVGRGGLELRPPHTDGARLDPFDLI